ncbi:hypothetical protein AB0N17_45595, partial [Streptomyces sp. NPDC051133]
FMLHLDERGAASGGVLASATGFRALDCTDSRTSAFVVIRPPIRTEARTVAPRVDGVIAVGGDHTRHDESKRIRQLASCLGGRVVGPVLDTGTQRSRFPRLRKQDSSTSPASLVGTREMPAPVSHTDGASQQQKTLALKQDTSVPDDRLSASR